MTPSNAHTFRTLVQLALGVTLWLGPAAGAQPFSEFRLVVHASNDLEEMRVRTVSRIFLGKQTRWENGSRIALVQPPMTSPTRAAFSTIIHGRSVGSVRNSWITEIYSGRGADLPEERKTDAEILAFVRADPNALGYVSAEASLGPGVRLIRVKE